MVYSAIFGFNPSKGARSPIIWNQLYRGLGIEGRMIAVDCETEEDFKQQFTKLSSDEDFQGGAIAAPYKELACQLASPSKKVFRDIPEALENNYNFPYRFNFKPKKSNPILSSLMVKK